VVFTADGETPTATSMVLQGDSVAASGVVFGQRSALRRGRSQALVREDRDRRIDHRAARGRISMCTRDRRRWVTRSRRARIAINGVYYATHRARRLPATSL